MESSTEGGCLCGAIRFALSEPAREAGYCQCTRCQRRTGTASSAQAHIDGRTFQLSSGGDALGVWRSPDGGFEKWFCRKCRAHVASRDPDDHARMAVRMSAFDGDPGVRPSWRGSSPTPRRGSRSPTTGSNVIRAPPARPEVKGDAQDALRSH